MATVQAWEGEGVVAAFRKVVGATNPLQAEPGTIRGDLARVIGRNIVHASDAPAAGAKESGDCRMRLTTPTNPGCKPDFDPYSPQTYPATAPPWAPRSQVILRGQHDVLSSLRMAGNQSCAPRQQLHCVCWVHASGKPSGTPEA